LTLRFDGRITRGHPPSTSEVNTQVLKVNGLTEADNNGDAFNLTSARTKNFISLSIVWNNSLFVMVQTNTW